MKLLVTLVVTLLSHELVTCTPLHLLRSRRSALTSSVSLARMMNMNNVIIIDATLSHGGKNASEEFQKKHIPGARFFDISECSSKTSPYQIVLPTQDQFEAYVGGLGISNGHHVVVYDNSPHRIFSAPRVWWMFRIFGHNDVSVLDGGLPKWENDGYDVTNTPSITYTAHFTTTFHPEMVKHFEDIIASLKTDQFQMVDARPPSRFNGADDGTDAVPPGHIPGSINIPFNLVLNQHGLMKSATGLKSLFREHGVDLLRPLVSTCRSGVLACILTLAAHECGLDMPVYDGSWSEYYDRASPDQMVLGPANANSAN